MNSGKNCAYNMNAAEVHVKLYRYVQCCRKGFELRLQVDAKRTEVLSFY